MVLLGLPLTGLMLEMLFDQKLQVNYMMHFMMQEKILQLELFYCQLKGPLQRMVYIHFALEEIKKQEGIKAM